MRLEKSRGAYPLATLFVYARNPSVAGHPIDIIFLIYDAFGVLPSVSSLTAAQAVYHFVTGCTVKVAGTEVGISEPAATFSLCFGSPFPVWRFSHPGD
jgi:phosphoenolpyruvate carboxykinase (ATP)